MATIATIAALPLLALRSTIPGIHWPPLVDGQGAVLATLLAQLELSQWLAPETIATRQLAQLGVLAEFCAEHSPHFRARLAASGIDAAALAHPGGLARLAPLHRRALQSAAGVHCEQVPERHLPLGETRTSGSTGEPVAVRRTAIGQLDWLAMTMRDHFWNRRDFAGRLATVRPQIEEVGQSEDWGAPVALLFDSGPRLRIPITTDAAEMLRLLAAFRPSSLLIYPSSLAALGEEAARSGTRIEGLAHIRTIGETLSAQGRAEARGSFGVDPVDAYSSQELGYIALQCPDAPGYHVMAETLIAEVVDAAGAPCAPGEVGRVLLTDLHNFATPLIRYDIGDYAEAGEPCACGRGLPTLRRILGRERNLIRMPDGTRHWPRVGFKRFREIAPIRQYQLLQHAPEEIEVRLVTERSLTRGEEAELSEHIAAALGHPFAIRLSYFDGRLPVGANGKFEEFKCLIE